MYIVFDLGDRISARLHTSGSEGGVSFRRVSFREKISARLRVARWRVSPSDAQPGASSTRGRSRRKRMRRRSAREKRNRGAHARRTPSGGGACSCPSLRREGYTCATPRSRGDSTRRKAVRNQCVTLRERRARRVIGRTDERMRRSRQRRLLWTRNHHLRAGETVEESRLAQDRESKRTVSRTRWQL